MARLFLRLGFTAFGGPAAHLSLIEDEVVHRRKWIDRQQLMDLVAALNFIPGPNSTELAIHLGLIRAGWRGLIVAGMCFIIPAMLIILPMAWFYTRFGSLPAVSAPLVGIRAAVLAVIAAALWRFGRTAIKDARTAVIAILAAAAMFANTLLMLHIPQAELIVLAAAAIGGMIGRISPPPALAACICPLAAAPLAAIWESAPRFLRLGLFFLKVGATLFGSGYVLVSYLQGGLVGVLAISPRELTDAIAVGQVTPGPLLTTATFVGYVLGNRWAGLPGGIFGGALATIAIFLPSFILVAALAPILHRIHRDPRARGALDGMNAAVVALILVVAVNLSREAIPAPWVDPLPAIIAAASLALMLLRNVNPTWLILAAAIVTAF